MITDTPHYFVVNSLIPQDLARWNRFQACLAAAKETAACHYNLHPAYMSKEISVREHASASEYAARELQMQYYALVTQIACTLFSNGFMKTKDEEQDG
jgi:hypothetical protein